MESLQGAAGTSPRHLGFPKRRRSHPAGPPPSSRDHLEQPRLQGSRHPTPIQRHRASKTPRSGGFSPKASLSSPHRSAQSSAGCLRHGTAATPRRNGATCSPRGKGRQCPPPCHEDAVPPPASPQPNLARRSHLWGAMGWWWQGDIARPRYGLQGDAPKSTAERGGGSTTITQGHTDSPEGPVASQKHSQGSCCSFCTARREGKRSWEGAGNPAKGTLSQGRSCCSLRSDCFPQVVKQLKLKKKKNK